VPDYDNSPTAAFDPAARPPDSLSDLTEVSLVAPGARPLRPPTVPGFEILREIGRGGMGVVYLARQVRLNRVVALKMVLSGEHASPADLIRFLSEAEAAAAISHPNVAQVYESGQHDGRPYFALEYCPGGSLAQRLNGTPLPPRDAAELIEQVARGVQAAHSAGIVHRDLKPANVLLARKSEPRSTKSETTPHQDTSPKSQTRPGGEPVSVIGSGSDLGVVSDFEFRISDFTPKVCDFGLARRAEGASGLTATGTVLGSPSYMAPEQARGKAGSVGPRADVYGVGAVLYECLTGRPPLRAATPMETLMQVLKDDPPAPRLLQPKLPRDVETICLKCLHKDPAKRYASAADLADDLRRFLDGRPIVARRVPWWERAWKAARRRPAAAGSLLVLVLAAAAVFGVIAWKNAQLQHERDAARSAETAARSAEEEARASREAAVDLGEGYKEMAMIAAAQENLARARLDTTLAAVDRMMVRVAGEQWAMNPALQQERKAVLEEAIAVYRGLQEADSKDPRVRRQTASAQMRVAGLYLFLADYPNCRKAADSAAELYRGLAAAAPSDPAPVRGEAEAVGLLGHVATLTADYDGSKANYERAAELAERAVRLDPGAPDSLLILTACLTSLGHYHGARNPAKSVECFTRALEVAAGLGAKPGAPFDHRLAHADALVNVAVLELNRDPTGPGREKLNQAGGLYDQLARERPPDARSAEAYTRNWSNWAVLQGQALFRNGRRDDGLKLMAQGLDGFDRALAVHPKSFPALISRMQYSATYSDLLQQAGKPAEALKALDAFARAQDVLIREHPQMTWVKGLGAASRSQWIIERVRTGECPDPQSEFDVLLTGLPPQQVPGIRYNLACALAQAAKAGPADDRERHAARAVAVLTELLGGPFFRNARNVTHLDDDTDLDPLRGRDDFKQFLRKAKAVKMP
jgi:serine/threonine protein kinase